MAVEDTSPDAATDIAADAGAPAATPAAFDPKAYLKAPAAPVVTFDPKAYLSSSAAPAEPEEPGVAASAVRGVAQGASFGFADEIAAALEGAFTSKTYKQALDESRASYAAARDAHPIAFGAGELAGGVGSAVVGGAAIGAAGKALGVAGKVAGLAAAGEEAGTAARFIPLAGDVAAGAAQGGLTAAGESEGDFGDRIRSAVEGAAIGGAAGGALGALGRNLTKNASSRATRDVAEAVTGNAPAKFAKKVAGDARDIEDTLFRPENKQILKNLGNTEKAVKFTESRMDAVGGELDKLKGELDEVTSSTVYRARAGGARRAAGAEGAAEGVAADGAAATSGRELAPVTSEGSTALEPRNGLARAEAEYQPPPGAAEYAPPRRAVDVEGREPIDMAPEIVKGGARLGDIVKPIEDRLATLERQPGNGAEKRALREMLDDVKDSWSPRVKGQPSYDPETIVSTKDLRAYTTQTQKLASNTIGTINESLASELKHDLSATVSKILNDHLDRAAATGPEAAAIVARMRTLNTEYSALANMSDAFRGRAWKEITARKSASQIVGDGAHAVGLTGALVAVATGHPYAAAAAVGLPLAKKLFDRAAVAGNRWLAAVVRAADAAAASGKALTKAQIQDLAVRHGATAAAAAVVAGHLANVPLGGAE